MSTAVVYLARGIGAGLPAAGRFFESYSKHPSGAKHDLIVLRKGWNDLDHSQRLLDLARTFSGQVLDLPDDGYDWSAYFRAANILKHKELLLLNSNSYILSHDWLYQYLNAADRLSVGATGATGSWQSIAPTFEVCGTLAKWVKKNRTIYHGLVEGAQQYTAWAMGPLNWRMRNFSKFPNRHLRSNAIFINRKLLLDFAGFNPFPTTKREAYYLESGRRGLAAYLGLRKLGIQVVDKNGRYFSFEEWPESQTYSSPGQKNLLIADKQTEIYRNGDLESQQFIEQLNWGRIIERIDGNV